MISIKIGSILTLKELEGRKFLVTKTIEGGFGIVFFLQSLSDFTNCVMKLFKNGVTLKDIEKEAFAWSQLGANDNIATFICYGYYNGEPYILSKRYENTFDSLIGSSINENLAKDLFKGVIKGLAFAYRKLHLIHRDIKPNNIFMEGSTPKLGDFGIAIYDKFEYKVSESLKSYKMITTDGDNTFGGTYPFMAPELFLENHHFTVSSDIFALGITFFLIYSNGLLPYDIRNHSYFTDVFAIFNHNCHDEELRRIILKCICLNPSERYKRYEDIPLYEDADFNSKDDINDIINTAQLLRRENKIDQAIAYVKDELVKNPNHPLLINQLAISYKELKNDNVFEFILSDFFESLELNFTPDLYFDPLFTLANHYFVKEDVDKFRTLLDKFEQYYKEYKETLLLYPEYAIYMAIKGYFYESYESFLYSSKHIKLPPKYWLFFLCVCKKIERYNEFRNVLSQNKHGEFEMLLFDDIRTLSGFNKVVEQIQTLYKEFTNDIF